MKTICCSYQENPGKLNDPPEYYFIHGCAPEDGAICVWSDDFNFEIPVEMVNDYDISLSDIDRRIDRDVMHAADMLTACATAEEAAFWLCHGDMPSEEFLMEVAV